MDLSVGDDAYNDTMAYGCSSYFDNNLCKQQEPWKRSLFEALQSIQPPRYVAAEYHHLFINPGLSIQGHPRLILSGPGALVQQETEPHQVDKVCGTLKIKRTRLSTANSSGHDLSILAWASNFDHQTSKLDSGYRLTISYNLYRTEPGLDSSSRQTQESERVAKLLSEWSRDHRMFDRYLYTLDDASQERPLSLSETKGRDRAVCQILSNHCAKAKLFMLFAEITHEVVDDCGDKRITSSINGVYTADGTCMNSYKTLKAKKELLGFNLDGFEDREADSDDDEDLPAWEACEEGESIKRYHDTAVILVWREHLLRTVTLQKPSDYNKSSVTLGAPDRGAKGVDALLRHALQEHPDDHGVKIVAHDAMQAVSKLADSLKAPMINEIVDWHLHRLLSPNQTGFSSHSIDDAWVYETAWETAPKCTADVVGEYLSLNYGGKEDSIDWSKW